MKTLKDFIIEQTNTEEVIDIPFLENEEMWAQRVIDEHKEEPKYEKDNGPLTEEQVKQVQDTVEKEVQIGRAHV